MSAEAVVERRLFRADGQISFHAPRGDRQLSPFSPVVNPASEVVAIMDISYATEHNRANSERFLSAARKLAMQDELESQLSERVLRFLLARDWQFVAMFTTEITGEDFPQHHAKYGFGTEPGREPFNGLAITFAQKAGVDIEPIKQEIAVAKKLDEVAFRLSFSGYAMWENAGEEDFVNAHLHAEKALKGLIDLGDMPNREYVPDDAKEHLFEAIDRLRDMSSSRAEVREILDAHDFEEIAVQVEVVFDRPAFEYRELLRKRAELTETRPYVAEQIVAIDAKLAQLRQRQITS